MENITDFFPYENSVEFDTERTLKWSNETILRAIEYYRTVCGVTIDYDAILAEVKAGTLRSIQALLYGALRSSDQGMTIQRYAQIYKKDDIHALGYINAVLEGILHYLPDHSAQDAGENLDPEWPDTQEEQKKKESAPQPTGDSGSGFVKKLVSKGKKFWNKRCAQ